MGVKVQPKGYKKARKHRKNCPCRKCQMVRDSNEQALQLDWLREANNG